MQMGAKTSSRSSSSYSSSLARCKGCAICRNSCAGSRLLQASSRDWQAVTICRLGVGYLQALGSHLYQDRQTGTSLLQQHQMLLGPSLLALLTKNWQIHLCSLLTALTASRWQPPKGWASACPCLASGPASGQRAQQQIHPWNRCQILHWPGQCALTQQGMLLVHPASGSCWAPKQSLGSKERSPCLAPGIQQQAWRQTQQMA